MLIMNFKQLIVRTSNSTVSLQKALNLLILVDFKQILESS